MRQTTAGVDGPIGLIGLGLLGSAVAQRLLAGGRAVLGYDLDPQRGAELAQCGGSLQASPAAVASACHAVVLCLPDSRVVAQVVHDLEGVLRPGQVLLDMTTGDPEETVALAGRLAERGVGLVEATVIGSSEQLRRGEALLLVSGPEGQVAGASGLLEALGCRWVRVGGPGQASRLKLVVNLVLGLNRAALAEGLALAETCGIPAAAALQVLRDSPAASRIMESKGPKMVAREYAPQARLAQHLKDVRLIRELAQRHGAWVPLSEVHEVLLARGVEQGWGEADNSALIEVYRNAPAQ